MGLSLSTICGYEKGCFPKRAESLYRLLNVLEVDLDYMLENRPCKNSDGRLRRIKSYGADIAGDEARAFALNLRKERKKGLYTSGAVKISRS